MTLDNTSQNCLAEKGSKVSLDVSVTMELCWDELQPTYQGMRYVPGQVLLPYITGQRAICTEEIKLCLLTLRDQGQTLGSLACVCFRRHSTASRWHLQRQPSGTPAELRLQRKEPVSQSFGVANEATPASHRNGAPLQSEMVRGMRLHHT